MVKLVLLAEASDLLAEAGIYHAAVDLDYLALGHWVGWPPLEVGIRNLGAIWSNYATLGLERLLLAEAIDTAAKRERLKEAIPGAQIVVCRLRAKLHTMQQRIRVREPGMLQEQLMARVAELESSLDAARIEDFCVENENRSVTEVAREVLLGVNWLTDDSAQ